VCEHRGKRGRLVRFSILARPELLNEYEQIVRRFGSDDAEVHITVVG
jgi:hypothetical protein